MTTEQGALRTSLGPGTLFVNRPALLLPELGEAPRCSSVICSAGRAERRFGQCQLCEASGSSTGTSLTPSWPQGVGPAAVSRWPAPVPVTCPPFPRFAKYYTDPAGTEHRTLIKAYGIRFDIIVFGKVAGH